MDRYTQRIMVMYQALLEFILVYMVTLITKTAVKDTFDQAKLNIDAIEKLVEDFEEATIGRTKAMQSASVKLKGYMGALCGALYRIGSKKHDDEIKAKADKTPSDWENMTEMELSTESKIVIDLADTLVPELQDFEYTPEKIIDIKDSHAVYKEKLGKRELSQAEKKAFRDEISAKIKENQVFLRKELDRVMLQFKDENRAMYDAYKAARSIKNLGIRHEKPAPDPGTPQNPPVNP